MVKVDHHAMSQDFILPYWNAWGVKLEAFIFDVFPMSSRIDGQPSGAEDENKFTE